MNKALKTSLPINSKIEPFACGSYFYDAWRIKAALPELDPLEQFMRVAKKTPAWIDTLMAMRNRVVSVFGLKDLGKLSDIDESKSAADYQVGQRVGIFTLIDKGNDEVLLGDEDNHLNVVLSVHKRILPESDDVEITVSTVVHIKNWLGRLYMIPVRLAHYVIVRRMVKLIGNVD